MGIFDFFKKKKEEPAPERKPRMVADSFDKPAPKREHHWTDDIFKMEIKDGVLERAWDTNVENGTFVVPKQAKKVNMFALKDCKSLETLVLHDDITYIAPHAFQGCENLKQIVGLENLTGMKTIAGFDGCKSLERVDLPETIGNIGDSAFKNCVRLQSIIIPDGVWGISFRAFENCAGLQYLEIPPSMTIIQPTAFAGCHNLNLTFLPERPFETPVIDMQIGDKNFAYPGGDVIIQEGALNDVKSVSAHDPHTIEKVIHSGYRGIVTYIDDENQQTITVDLGFVERYYGGLAQDKQDIADEVKRIEELYYDKFGYPTEEELAEEEKNDELGDEE